MYTRRKNEAKKKTKKVTLARVTLRRNSRNCSSRWISLHLCNAVVAYPLLADRHNPLISESRVQGTCHCATCPPFSNRGPGMKNQGRLALGVVWLVAGLPLNAAP